MGNNLSSSVQFTGWVPSLASTWTDIVGITTDTNNTEATFMYPGTYSWTSPITGTVSVVCIGAGGSGTTYGSGGSLAYRNSISVVSGNTYTVIVGAGTAGSAGGDSCFFDYSVTGTFKITAQATGQFNISSTTTVAIPSNSFSVVVIGAGSGGFGGGGMNGGGGGGLVYANNIATIYGGTNNTYTATVGAASTQATFGASTVPVGNPSTLAQTVGNTTIITAYGGRAPTSGVTGAGGLGGGGTILTTTPTTSTAYSAGTFPGISGTSQISFGGKGGKILTSGGGYGGGGGGAGGYAGSGGNGGNSSSVSTTLPSSGQTATGAFSGGGGGAGYSSNNTGLASGAGGGGTSVANLGVLATGVGGTTSSGAGGGASGGTAGGTGVSGLNGTAGSYNSTVAQPGGAGGAYGGGGGGGGGGSTGGLGGVGAAGGIRIVFPGSKSFTTTVVSDVATTASNATAINTIYAIATVGTSANYPGAGLSPYVGQVYQSTGPGTSGGTLFATVGAVQLPDGSDMSKIVVGTIVRFSANLGNLVSNTSYWVIGIDYTGLTIQLSSSNISSTPLTLGMPTSGSLTMYYTNTKAVGGGVSSILNRGTAYNGGGTPSGTFCGGAAGYGGQGGLSNNLPAANTGGGAGGNGTSGGGGVNVYGLGPTATGVSAAGQGGSYGYTAASTGAGGLFGGGSTASFPGANGAVRIVWGVNSTFSSSASVPSKNTSLPYGLVSNTGILGGLVTDNSYMVNTGLVSTIGTVSLGNATAQPMSGLGKLSLIVAQPSIGYETLLSTTAISNSSIPITTQTDTQKIRIRRDVNGADQSLEPNIPITTKSDIEKVQNRRDITDADQSNQPNVQTTVKTDAIALNLQKRDTNLSTQDDVVNTIGWG